MPRQQFSATPLNTIRLPDIADLPGGGGLLYLSAVLDLAARKNVGWSMRDQMRAELTSAALMMAIERKRPCATLVCHSDLVSR